MSRIGLLLSRIRMSLIRLVLSPQIWLVLAFLVCSSSLFVAIFCRYPLILDTMCLVEIVRWKWLHHKDNLKWALMILASTLPFNLFLQATHLPVPRRREVTILLWILCILMIIPYILILWVDIVREWWWEREERMWEAWMAERECAASEWPRMRETSDRASLRHLRQEMNQLPRSLKELHITELPSTFENLSNLEVLELDGSFSKMLPPSLSVLSNLKELRLVACPRLMCLPDSLGLLSVLEVKCCSGLVEVGTLPSTLIHLSLISCLNLKKIDGLCGLTKLQTLNISGWREVEELAGIETLVSLEQLRASGCENMQRIRGLGKLTKLKQLDVHGCSEIEELEGVEHLTLLEKLDASDCPALHWDGKVLEQLPRRLKEGMLYI